jgi:hypothetical protein
MVMPKKTPLRVVKKYVPGIHEVGAPNGNSNAVVHGCYADLSSRNLDGRTKLARALRAVEGDLVSAVGGNPTPQETIIIQRVVYKLARCTMFEAASLNGQGKPADEHYLAWANSLRLDLVALGLQRREKQVMSLHAYLATKEGVQP